MIENRAIFQTERLEIKQMNQTDFTHFVTLLSDPQIIQLIPQKAKSKAALEKMFVEFTNSKTAPEIVETTVFGVYEKGSNELIGLSGFLTNNETHREIGYRLRKEFWRKGYGTELVSSMISYSFNYLNIEVLTADVWTENTGSVKILEKYFKPVKEFYNKEDKCTDRRYHLSKLDWLKTQTK